jgi:hypothetical protein
MNELYYSISVDPKEFENLDSPKRTKKYFKKRINAISKDAKKKGDLEKLTVEISCDKRYLDTIKQVSNELYATSLEHEKKREKIFSDVTSYGALSGLVVGALAGLANGDNLGSKLASILLGGTVGYIFSRPFVPLETPLARRVKQYESIKNAEYVFKK